MGDGGKLMDLNCDLGESYGVYQLGHDADMIPLVTSANVACGYHGGDPAVMNAAVLLARESGVAVGAHPSFPDLQGFGRRRMNVGDEELYAMLVYQIGALKGFTDAHHVPLQHVKPHGALNNMASENIQLARVVAQAVRDVDAKLILLAPVGSQLVQAGRELGLRVGNEVFADRSYEPDGSLRSRHYPDALLQTESEVVEHVLRMVEGSIRTVDDIEIPVAAHSICLHGDNESAVTLAKAIRQALMDQGIQLQSLAAVLRSEKA